VSVILFTDAVFRIEETSLCVLGVNVGHLPCGTEFTNADQFVTRAASVHSLFASNLKDVTVHIPVPTGLLQTVVQATMWWTINAATYSGNAALPLL
jgi:hypothetical protein